LRNELRDAHDEFWNEECAECLGSGECTYCSGSGECSTYHKDDDHSECDDCGGTNECEECLGNGECTYCEGTGHKNREE
jgi:hypothetical protein